MSKTQRWLLAASTALTLPAVPAIWWMLSTPPSFRATEEEIDGDGIRSANGEAALPRAESLESRTQENEFRTYAAALKAQGQPEATVRELIASRITAAYQARRAAIWQQARKGDASSMDIHTQLDALSREQEALIGRIVGEEQKPVNEIATAEVAAAAPPQAIENQPLMPAVMAEALPATVKTEEQAAEWEKLRNDFVKAIGGENQDPTTPQYRKRWAQAQSEADQRYRLLFGDNAYVAMQMKAQHEAMLKEQGQAK